MTADPNDYARGSGSNWADLDGDPSIIPGALVLVGEHRLVGLSRNPTNGQSRLVGTICHVVEDHGNARPSKIRYVGVLPFFVNEALCANKPGWTRARDCVLLRTVNGGVTDYLAMLDHLWRNKAGSWPTRTALAEDAGTASCVARWAIRIGAAREEHGGRDAGYVAPVPVRLRQLLPGRHLSHEDTPYGPGNEEQCVNRMSRYGAPVQVTTLDTPEKIDASMEQLAREKREGILATNPKPARAYRAALPITAAEYAAYLAEEAGKAAKFDGGDQHIPVEPVVPPDAAQALGWLDEQMARSHYVGPRPHDAVRARAMITLAACRSSLTMDERVVVEDWTGTRDSEKRSEGARLADWDDACRGDAWLKTTFRARYVYDERSLQAITEQVAWLKRHDPTTPREKPTASPGGLDAWLRSPLGQPVRRR